MDLTAPSTQNARRKALQVATGILIMEEEFGYAEKAALETLVEMVQAFICELGRSSRAYCELGGRTKVVLPDIIIALIEMGQKVDEIPTYGRKLMSRPRTFTVPNLVEAPKAVIPKILAAGEKKPLATYIPDHLPPFPDPHSYIRTPTHKLPETQYESIREKAATQKRDVERALTRFIAKSETAASAAALAAGGPSQPNTHSLFPDEHLSNMYPLISMKNPRGNGLISGYLHALLPQDQIFDEDEPEEQKEGVDQQANKDQQSTEGAVKEDPNDTGDPNTSTEDGQQSARPEGTTSAATEPNPENSEQLDNPYLRPARLARKPRNP